MAKTFWGYWDCEECGGINISGKERACPSCGSSRSDSELANIRPNKREEVYDAAAIQSEVDLTTEEGAKAGRVGADLICQYCGTTNWATNENCVECGGADWSPFQIPPTSAPDPVPPVENYKMGKTTAKVSAASVLVLAIVSMICCGLFGGLVWWGSLTTEYMCTVNTTTWEHTTHKETFQPTTSGDWEANIHWRKSIMPVNGQGEDPGAERISCAQKHHHDRKFVCGTETYQQSHTRQVADGQTCHTPSPVNNGDGSFTQPSRVCSTKYRSERYYTTETRDKMCSEPIYKSYCSIRTYQWANSGKHVDTGEGPQIGDWSHDMVVGVRDRTRKQSAYQVAIGFQVPEKPPREHILKDLPLDEFQRWTPGEEGFILIRNTGGVDPFDRDVFEGKHHEEEGR